MRLTTHVHVKAVKIQKLLYVLILVFNWSFDLISIFANLWYYYTVISSWWNYFQLSSAPPRATFRINDLLLFCRVFNWNSARNGSPNFGPEKLETASQVWKTSSDTWSHLSRREFISVFGPIAIYKQAVFLGATLLTSSKTGHHFPSHILIVCIEDRGSCVDDVYGQCRVECWNTFLVREGG